MLPFVYVVRADGEKLYSHSGILQSNEIREMLVSELEKAGKSFSAKDTALLTKALEDAKRAKETGDLREAVKALLPLKKLGPLGKIACFTGPGLEANKLVAQLTEQGNKMLKKVDEECADDKPTLDAMLTYVKARREFARCPRSRPNWGPRPASTTIAMPSARSWPRPRSSIACRSRSPPTMPRRAAESRSGLLPPIRIRRSATAGDGRARRLPKKGPRHPLPTSRSPPIEPGPTPPANSPLRHARCGVEGEKLSLETEDGRKIRIPVEKLSEADRKFLKSQQEKE